MTLKLDQVWISFWSIYPKIRKLKMHLFIWSNKYFLPRRANKQSSTYSSMVTQEIFRCDKSRSQISIRRISELCYQGSFIWSINLEPVENIHIFLAQKILKRWLNKGNDGYLVCKGFRSREEKEITIIG